MSEHRIKLPRSTVLQSVVPGYVWRCRPFKYRPAPFAIQSEQLKNRLVEEEVQLNSLEEWLKAPTLPALYGVSGAPDDEQAQYFAAWLVYKYLAMYPNKHVVWESIKGGFAEPKAMSSGNRPSLLVVTNITVDSTAQRIEKVRDLLVYFSDIPRIVVSAGIDPISFFSTRLYLPIHRMAFFLGDTVRTKISVI